MRRQSIPTMQFIARPISEARWGTPVIEQFLPGGARHKFSRSRPYLVRTNFRWDSFQLEIDWLSGLLSICITRHPSQRRLAGNIEVFQLVFLFVGFSMVGCVDSLDLGLWDRHFGPGGLGPDRGR